MQADKPYPAPHFHFSIFIIPRDLSSPAHTLFEAMEDFNIPNPKRVALLERLQDAIGGAPPHFWAACQICDLKALERLVECGHEYPEILRAFSQQTYTMAHYCK